MLYDKKKIFDIASQLPYSGTPYRTKDGLPKGATIKSGGCGPSAVRNLGNNLLGWNTSIPAVAQIAVSCGARYNGGTTISTLLKAMLKKRGGFTYTHTTNDAAAADAVRKGAMCIIHTTGAVGGTYNKLLSSSGHFMCLAAVDDTYGYIIDSCSYDGKWTASANRKKYCKLVQPDGLVRVPLSAISAVIDYYYIVTPIRAAKTTAKEDDEMIEKTKFAINGKKTELNAITKNGSTFVNLREYNKVLGLVTDYHDGTRTVDMEQIPLKINETETSVPGMSLGGTTYGAIRALFESAGFTVDWDGKTKTVIVKKE